MEYDPFKDYLGFSHLFEMKTHSCDSGSRDCSVHTSCTQMSQPGDGESVASALLAEEDYSDSRSLSRDGFHGFMGSLSLNTRLCTSEPSLLNLPTKENEIYLIPQSDQLSRLYSESDLPTPKVSPVGSVGSISPRPPGMFSRDSTNLHQQLGPASCSNPFLTHEPLQQFDQTRFYGNQGNGSQNPAQMDDEVFMPGTVPVNFCNNNQGVSVMQQNKGRRLRPMGYNSDSTSHEVSSVSSSTQDLHAADHPSVSYASILKQNQGRNNSSRRSSVSSYVGSNSSICGSTCSNGQNGSHDHSPNSINAAGARYASYLAGNAYVGNQVLVPTEPRPPMANGSDQFRQIFRNLLVEEGVPVGVTNGYRPPGTRYGRKEEGLCCAFCKRNGETREYYTTHVVKDNRGKVICPILRKYRCPICNATGDTAHTQRHCPLYEERAEASAAETFRTQRSSCGKRRTSPVWWNTQ